MPNFTAGTSFTDGVTNDVTALKLNALVADAVPTSSLALASTSGTISNFTSSTATLLGAITGSTNVINIGSGQIYKDASGNVGVGTASPTSLLHIKKANALVNLDNADGNNSIWQQTSTDTRFGSQSSIPIAFYTNSVERLRIDASGNVGIGTNSPVNNGSAYATLSINGSTGGAQEFQTAGSSVAQIYNDSNALFINAFSGKLTIFQTAGTERLRIDSSGNCSIGTATALSRLHVHGDLTMSNATVSTTAATGGFTLPATAAGYLTVSINGTSRKIPYYA
jgi:hypothetical protein